ncbi:MAG: alpha/beta hydrolase, partial [Candidatus Binataceae bacterium]
MATDRDREFLKQMAAAARPMTSVEELRAALATFAPMMNQNLPEVGAFHDNVELRANLRADVSVPKGDGPFPVVVYLHGGGWVAGSPKSHQKLGMQFAESGYLCINADYRLAPEHPFPAGLDDCVFAIKWAADNAKRWNGNASRLAVGGDSAGANLTAASLAALAAEN